MTKLVTPPQVIVDRLATEILVAEHDVRMFVTQLSGLTSDAAIALLDDLSFRRSWNMPTRMAAAELLDEASPQRVNKRNQARIDVQDKRFCDRLGEVVEDILAGSIDVAATYLYVIFVDRLSQSTHNHNFTFDEVIEEASIEMVLAMADQAPLMVGRSLSEMVERFMTAHVRPLKDDILADVVANLYIEAWSDNDTTV